MGFRGRAGHVLDNSSTLGFPHLALLAVHSRAVMSACFLCLDATCFASGGDPKREMGGPVYPACVSGWEVLPCLVFDLSPHVASARLSAISAYTIACLQGPFHGGSVILCPFMLSHPSFQRVMCNRILLPEHLWPHAWTGHASDCCLFLPCRQLSWCPYLACRVGEAKQPGPTARRLRSKTPASSTAYHRMSTQQTMTTAVDTEIDTLLSEEQSLPMTSSAHDTIVMLRKLLDVCFRRPDGSESHAYCSYVASKNTWRWQSRAKPALISVERKSAGSALAGWIHKNTGGIHEESGLELEQHVGTLLSHHDDLMTYKHHMSSRAPLQAGDPALCSSQNLSYAHGLLDIQTLESLLAAHVPVERFLPPASCVVVAAVIRQLAARSWTPEAALTLATLP